MEINYQSAAPAALWTPSVRSVYLFYGEEDQTKEMAIAALTSRLIDEDSRDFDFEKLDVGTSSPDTILSAVSQMPFSSNRRLVIVRGMEQWRPRSRQGEADRLAEGVTRLAAFSCLVLVVSAEEEESKRKVAVSSKLDNAVREFGALVAFRALRGTALTEWIREEFGKESKSIGSEAVEQLISSVGKETHALEQEIHKLISYVGERKKITETDVATVVASAPEDVIYATVEAISKRQTDRALSLLSELNRYDPSPRAVAGKLIALLSRQYRMLWQAKYLVEKRISPRDVRSLPPEISAELPGDSNIAQLAFKASELFQCSKIWTWDELNQAMTQLLICDLANKGGVTEETEWFGTDPARNLQLLIINLTGAASAG